THLRLTHRPYRRGAIPVRRRDRSASNAQGMHMTIGPTPRVRRVWDWLTGAHSKKSAYWLILGPAIALTCIGVVMVLSASSVEFIGGAGSFASLSSQGIYAILGLVLLFWMGRWTRRTYHKLAVIMLL